MRKNPKTIFWTVHTMFKSNLTSKSKKKMFPSATTWTVRANSKIMTKWAWNWNTISRTKNFKLNCLIKKWTRHYLSKYCFKKGLRSFIIFRKRFSLVRSARKVGRYSYSFSMSRSKLVLSRNNYNKN